MNILILGASGMLGNTIFRYLSLNRALSVHGTIRSNPARRYFNDDLNAKIISNIDVENYDSLINLFKLVKPNVVINCVGLVKQLSASDDILYSIPINTLLPHRLAILCNLINARLIHFSTDCVFSGSKGMYSEFDAPDALDLYGKTKFLGEVSSENAITLRTSIIGHELNGNRSLLNWFLSQNGSISGYTKAIFSGLPAIEIARIIDCFILPNSSLKGLYHLSVDPISKFDLLNLISQVYKKNIIIIPDGNLIIDRSLNSSRFYAATGYKKKSWSELITLMHSFN